MAYGFGPLRLKKIIGIVDRENKASIRVLEKIGLTFEKFTTYRGFDVAWYVKETEGH
jgi:ribosomal-protein-alanine N-acetyltransferase